jgi:glutamyl-tRNA reductase
MFNIDELTAITQTNFQERLREVEKVQRIINIDVDKFIKYWHELKVKPLITSLVTKAEIIRKSKLDLTLKKVPELSIEQRSHIEALSKSIIQNILHEPIECLKSNHKNEEYFRIVSELFCLSEEK